MNIQNIKWAIALSLVAIVGMIVYFSVTSFSRIDKEEVVFNVAPSFATVTANGKKIGSGSQYLAPGKYEIVVSAKNFNTKKQQIIVNKGDKPQVFVALAAANEEGMKWIEANQRAYLDIEGKGGEYLAKRGEEKRDTFPIIELLPYEEDNYTIGYKSPTEDRLILTIHATSSLDRQVALSRIKSWGYDPANYEIEFTDYHSPFISGSEAGDEVDEH